ncbi:MAG: hypothetical protein H6668_06925 [Ardenticatenaceae bacterium]|nr:hypothetical protein [Ardenticatenaceae bacterium]
MWSDLWFLHNEFVLSLLYILFMGLLVVFAALLSKVADAVLHRASRPSSGANEQTAVNPLAKQH